MLDFMTISTRSTKRGTVEIYPKFIINTPKDLMIRGRDFYAIWDEERGLWSTDEQDVIRLVDNELRKYAEENRHKFDSNVHVKYMWDAESGIIDSWHKYCQKQMRDSFHMLDEKLIFSNTKTNKRDYASKRLEYPLEAGDIVAYDKLISTLYSEEERHKIEWAIGSILSGDSKKIQKFLVLYGEGGTGKSTILNIIQQLFEGYYAVFDAKALGSASNQFALEAFKTNPLVAIQHDGDLSKIEDNTRLNSLVSHELMTVNEKFKGTYSNRFKCFLFMGTNKPVKITDAKSGLIRRLIDVTPTGNKLSRKEYNAVTKQVSFELGAIAQHCLDVYLDDPGRYDDYIPLEMMGASNDFYNFILDAYHIFKAEDGVTLKAAWEMYKTYCDEAKVPYPFSQRNFKEELKNYFMDFNERFNLEDGSRVRSYYSGFRTEKFEVKTRKKKDIPKHYHIDLDSSESIFDKDCAMYPAQYASAKETPRKQWIDISTTLSELDTSKLHFVKVPENHIVIDFDIKDEFGNKSFERNLEEASKWPKTYAELSKSGGGIHLHYIYTGDPLSLSRIYDDNIEIKVFAGNSSLRRKLTKCNGLPIATISSGLPLKGEKMINFEGVKSEKALRTLIKRNLNKEYHADTTSSINFIYKILDDAYNSGLGYDVTDLRNAVLAFAANATNQADTCVKTVNKMQFKSEDPNLPVDNGDETLIFYDVEVFPNLFLVNWKVQGEGKPVVRMINPSSTDIEDLLKFNLIGFYNRDYDNHMLYARMMGYTNEQLFKLSQRLTSKDKKVSREAKFKEAYNLSYTDVYDFSVVKQSLKKWEIDLGIHHQELGLPWDQPVPEEKWIQVAEYCDNDVIATEAVFNDRYADFMARKIQVDLVKLIHGGSVSACVNDSTNTLSAKIIFGNNRKPQSEFNYRDLSKPVGSDQYEEYKRKFGEDYKFRVFDDNGLPLYRDYVPGEKLPKGYSILPFFKAYKYEFGKSTYNGIEVGEGGAVFGNPGLWGNVWDGDIASQHPHSIICEVLFGVKFTKIFAEVVQARVAVKHKDFETAGKLLNGALKPYLTEEHASDLAQALKIVINSIYGMTSAAFMNVFKDPRNVDNIVAKRGNLFMHLLKDEVEKRGYTVAHIKTDSIKIPNATEEIKDFVTKFGKEFGYTFETEAVFSRFGLVNDAVYIAKFNEPEIDKKTGEEIWWTATGTQFAVPYVFKTLFSKKPIEFSDLCETKAVTTALYLDMNEKLPDVSEYEKIKLLRSKERHKLNNKQLALVDSYADISEDKLDEMIAEGHDYHFVGKIGQFCPVKPNCGGGSLMRESDGKYYAATGSKGYRWIESEALKGSGSEDIIDTSYYRKLVDDAVDTLSSYGDFEWFISDDVMTPNEMRQEMCDACIPPWSMPCGDMTVESCFGCPNYYEDPFHADCKDGYDISNIVLKDKTNKKES